MSNEPVKKNFNVVDAVAGRIRDSSLGQFIDEDDIIPIVKEAIQKVFFEDQYISNPNPNRSYNEPGKVKVPAFIVSMVEERFSKRIDEMVIKAMQEMDDDFKAQVLASIEAQMEKITVDRLMRAMLERFMGDGLDMFRARMGNDIRNMIMNMR